MTDTWRSRLARWGLSPWSVSLWTFFALLGLGVFVWWLLLYLDTQSFLKATRINVPSDAPLVDAGVYSFPSGGSVLRAFDTAFQGLSTLPATEQALALPASFAFVDPDAVLPVRDQRTCNSCWAVALCQVLADRIALLSDQYYRVPLAPQQLVSCSGQPDSCAAGGDVVAGIVYAQTFGLVPEAEFPYQNADTIPCELTKTSSYRVHVSDTDVFRLGVGPITVGDAAHQARIALMKHMCYVYGPLLVTINWHEDLLRWPAHKVFGLDSAHAQTDNGYHTVELLGWHDSDVPAQNYWVCRNVWGPTWPAGVNDVQGGIFYVAKGLNAANVERFALSIQPQVQDRDALVLLREGFAYVNYERRYQEKLQVQNWLLPGWAATWGGVTLAALWYGVSRLSTRYAELVRWWLTLALVVGAAGMLAYAGRTYDATNVTAAPEAQVRGDNVAVETPTTAGTLQQRARVAVRSTDSSLTTLTGSCAFVPQFRSVPTVTVSTSVWAGSNVAVDNVTIADFTVDGLTVNLSANGLAATTYPFSLALASPLALQAGIDTDAAVLVAHASGVTRLLGGAVDTPLAWTGSTQVRVQLWPPPSSAGVWTALRCDGDAGTVHGYVSTDASGSTWSDTVTNCSVGAWGPVGGSTELDRYGWGTFDQAGVPTTTTDAAYMYSIDFTPLVDLDLTELRTFRSTDELAGGGFANTVTLWDDEGTELHSTSLNHAVDTAEPANGDGWGYVTQVLGTAWTLTANTTYRLGCLVPSGKMRGVTVNGSFFGNLANLWIDASDADWVQLNSAAYSAGAPFGYTRTNPEEVLQTYAVACRFRVSGTSQMALHSPDRPAWAYNAGARTVRFVRPQPTLDALETVDLTMTSAAYATTNPVSANGLYVAYGTTLGWQVGSHRGIYWLSAANAEDTVAFSSMQTYAWASDGPLEPYVHVCGWSVGGKMLFGVRNGVLLAIPLGSASASPMTLSNSITSPVATPTTGPSSAAVQLRDGRLLVCWMSTDRQTAYALRSRHSEPVERTDWEDTPEAVVPLTHALNGAEQMVNLSLCTHATSADGVAGDAWATLAAATDGPRGLFVRTDSEGQWRAEAHVTIDTDGVAA